MGAEHSSYGTPPSGAAVPSSMTTLFATSFRRRVLRVCFCNAGVALSLVAVAPSVIAQQPHPRISAATSIAPVALVALQHALIETWRAWGITADYAVGHGAGAYAAGCLARVFSLEDALRLAAAERALRPCAGGCPAGRRKRQSRSR